MPTLKLRAGRGAALAALALTALAVPSAALAGPAPAGCTIPATTQAFAQFGDTSNYYLADGGAFEGSKTSWRLSGGAGLVAGSEPFALVSTTHSSALRVPSGATAQSGRFCVSSEIPHLRFVARSAGGGDLTVRIDTYATGGALIGSRTQTVAAAAHTAWAPTAFIDLDTSAMAPGEKALAQMTVISHGDWRVDSVFIDPYAR
jgi:hypothetical protein